MKSRDQVDTHAEAKSAIDAALDSVAKGRTIRVDPDGLDRYFDLLKVASSRK